MVSPPDHVFSVSGPKVFLQPAQTQLCVAIGRVFRPSSLSSLITGIPELGCLLAGLVTRARSARGEMQALLSDAHPGVR